tara:strand:- start:105 stop:566 length:462 start_codon:yes stop_codon:yes gene_type:complete
MDTFIPVSLRKLNELLKRPNFVLISDVSNNSVTIEYTDRVCTISNFGKVEWVNTKKVVMLDNLKNIKHPFYNQDLEHAISVAQNKVPKGKPPLKTLQEVRDTLQAQADIYKADDFAWLTGEVALEIVDAVIQNKLITEIIREKHEKNPEKYFK